MKTAIYVLIFLLASAFGTIAQIVPPYSTKNQTNYYPQGDTLQNISQEITKISKSVQNFNNGIKELLEKLMVGKGMQLTERQQKLLLGFEVLNRAEQRVEILQKFQIELTQKEGEVKIRMGQVEEASFPDSIDRNVAVIGTTRTEELRQGRRQTLNNERQSLQNLLAQIRRNLSQTNEELRQAELFVNTLRRKVLPQIEAEISDL
jgi:uncharacterized protein YukE